MKFCEAMERLENGGKVTRSPWKDGVYFKVVDGDVKSFQSTLSAYSYNEDIMISAGWLVDTLPEAMKFCEIIPYLINGKTARQHNWEDSYIYFDLATKAINRRSMEIFPFIPHFESFVAQDWVQL